MAVDPDCLPGDPLPGRRAEELDHGHDIFVTGKGPQRILALVLSLDLFDRTAATGGILLDHTVNPWTLYASRA